MTDAPTQQSGIARPPLAGRERELTLLRELLSADAHHVRVVVIEGEPGMGKTRLLHAATETVPAGIHVVRARGYALERERPFGTMIDAFGLVADSHHPATRAIAALLESTAGDAPSASHESFPMLRFRVAGGIVELIGSLTSDGPVLVLIEDLHWVDDSSLLTIEQVARRLVDRPITIVATTRPAGGSLMLEAVRSELTSAGVTHIGLEPLAAPEVVALTTSVLAAPPGPTLTEVIVGAAGNPLYITELLAALVADDAVRVDAGVAEIDDPAVPASLDMAILSGLGYLPSESLELLREASILGSHFVLDDLSVFVNRPASTLVRTLAPPLEAGLLHESDGALEFRHDLVRDAIYRDMPRAARRALHMQAARRLSAAGRAPTAVAAHYLEGAEPGDAGAISWLTRAAEDARPRSPTVAAELFEGAVALCRDGQPERDALLLELVRALRWSGRNQEARDLVAELETRPHEAATTTRLHVEAAATFSLLGHERDAIPHYEAVLDSPHLTDRQRARLRSDVAAAQLMVGELDAARRSAEDACERGRRLGDDPALCGGLRTLCYLANARGRTREAIAFGEEAVQLARHSPDRETARGYPQTVLATILVDADRLDEADRTFYEGRRVAEGFGDRYMYQYADFGQMLVHFYAGRLDDATVALETAHREAVEVGVRGLVVWGQAVGARVAIRRGELDVAAQLLSSADEEVARVGPRIGFDWLLWCRALLQQADGDLTASAATLETAWELASALGIISQARLIGPDLVLASLAVDHLDVARDVTAHLEELAELGGTSGGRAMALRCRGCVEQDPDLLLRSVEEYRSSPRALERADAMRDASSCLTTAGRVDEARGLLEEAAALYTAAGATHDQRDVEAALSALGVTARRPAARSRPRFGWEALTPTELEVARLAARGLSNPEIARARFVSPRTIETHLSNSFTKLGVTSRVALAAEVVRRDG